MQRSMRQCCGADTEGAAGGCRLGSGSLLAKRGEHVPRPVILYIPRGLTSAAPPKHGMPIIPEIPHS